jgi:hypothetical protein
VPHGSRKALQYRASPAAVGHGGMHSFVNFFGPYIFEKRGKKNVKKLKP